jgi:hypothetical protein
MEIEEIEKVEENVETLENEAQEKRLREIKRRRSSILYRTVMLAFQAIIILILAVMFIIKNFNR